MPAKLEFHSLARETMLLDIIRDGLGEELTTDEIGRRELALDKEIIQLLQSACKADKLARAIDLVKLLHHTASFDMAIKLAGFYHLLGLQEKIELLRDEREHGEDRLERAREKRKDRDRDFAAIAAPRVSTYAETSSRPKPFQDFKAPPAVHRPGLERVGPSGSKVPERNTQSSVTILDGPSWETDDSQLFDDDYAPDPSVDGKRKRSEERESSAGVDPKRRALAPESASTSAPARRKLPRTFVPFVHKLMSCVASNPFARKPAAAAERPNVFATRPAEPLAKSRSLHKSETFFTKVDAAEADQTKRKCSSYP